uniref:Ig-like domain-containing protein n=1 Tax=Erpetoichthys calabaricus TaxID=27687 RepID=A0A8C4SKS3_ERPCA
MGLLMWIFKFVALSVKFQYSDISILTELPKMMIVPDILVRGIDQIISCIIDGHLPEEISITWKKNGVPLRKTKTKDDGTFITTESLMLNPVDENDEFTCEVKVMNEIISTTKKFQFTGKDTILNILP